MSIIKSFSVGEGDMFYINHESNSFTIIDCNLTDRNKEEIIDELKKESEGKAVIRFISTHPDDDHISGLKYLDDRMKIVNFYCVKNETTKKDATDDFEKYCELRKPENSFYLKKGCSRSWLTKDDDEKHYGSAGLNILWPIIDNTFFREELKNAKEGKSPNNISPIIKYGLEDGAAVLWFGDLKSDFMDNIIDDVDLVKADIIFAPHHGRKSGKIPKKWLDKMNPKIIVVGEADSEVLDYYQGYNTITQNSAGDIIFECVEKCVDVYVSSEKYTVDFLKKDDRDNRSDGYYIGSLKI